MKTKKFAVILAGCGVYDGAEIHESVLTLLAIDELGCQYELFAPDIAQLHVVNHLTGKSTDEKRNVLVESARIARGKIKNLLEYKPNDFDGIIFPGGFGVAKNLFSFAIDGIDCTVNPIVEKAIKDTHRAAKPIGALCISPVLIAKVIGNVEITIGNDPGTAEAVKAMGAKHKETKHGEIVVDAKNKVVTTPCYMLQSTISQIYKGAYNLVEAMIKL
ncbi:MAG TPA: isoprenoid biosynthesis glyoxalase ElbB [Salinivirgaceae bacterium]|nr:isoprenoid biosynthesis glyoxalase ElbB [Salinivirgaceae bacterium]